LNNDIAKQEKEARASLMSTRQSVIIQEFLPQLYYSIKYFIWDEKEQIQNMGTISFHATISIELKR
jgi:hypothetical protein